MIQLNTQLDEWYVNKALYDMYLPYLCNPVNSWVIIYLMLFIVQRDTNW